MKTAKGKPVVDQSVCLPGSVKDWTGASRSPNAASSTSAELDARSPRSSRKRDKGVKQHRSNRSKSGNDNSHSSSAQVNMGTRCDSNNLDLDTSGKGVTKKIMVADLDQGRTLSPENGRALPLHDSQNATVSKQRLQEVLFGCENLLDVLVFIHDTIDKQIGIVRADVEFLRMNAS
jgi:hypothetical protein